MDVVSGYYVLEVVCYVQQLTDTVSKPLTHSPVLLVCSSGNTSSSPFLSSGGLLDSRVQREPGPSCAPLASLRESRGPA